MVELAHECGLKEKITDLLQGERVNFSQNLPALHTALRAKAADKIYVDGYDIMPDVMTVREAMRDIADTIRAGLWLGYSGKPIRSLVNIGMGGSDFGPRLCIDALSSYTTAELTYHFISDADPYAFDRVVARLDPETTLFIVSSKSFTTKETYTMLKKL